MRFINIFLLLILQIVTVCAQISDPPKRDITLTIVNKRGRPLKNIIVKSIDSSNAGLTDSKGLYVFKYMTDDDTISVLLPKYGQTHIPVAGMDSIVVRLNSARLYSYETSEGYRSIVKKEAKQGNDLVDVPELVKRCSCTSLFELLNGNIPGLVMGNGSSANGTQGSVSATIRGTKSLTQSNEPYVVLNGMPLGTLDQANSMLSVYDIKTIEIVKNGYEWGVLGANGVILITTK